MKLATLKMLGASELLQSEIEISDCIFLTDTIIDTIKSNVVKLTDNHKTVYGTVIPYTNPNNENDVVAVPVWMYNIFSTHEVEVASFYPLQATQINLKPYKKQIYASRDELHEAMKHHTVYQKGVVFPLHINDEKIYMEVSYIPDGPCVTIRQSFVSVSCELPIDNNPMFIGTGYKLGGETKSDPRAAFLEAMRKRQQNNT